MRKNIFFMITENLLLACSINLKSEALRDCPVFCPVHSREWNDSQSESAHNSLEKVGKSVSQKDLQVRNKKLQGNINLAIIMCGYWIWLRKRIKKPNLCIDLIS